MPRKYRQSFLSLRRRECLNAWLTWGPSKYREAAAQSSTLKGQAPTLRRDQAMKGMEGASGQVKLHRYVARGRPGSPDFRLDRSRRALHHGKSSIAKTSYRLADS